MNQLPSQCPICKGEIVITRLHCRSCDTTFDGHFTGSVFSQLTPEQMQFVEIFVRSEGKLNRMEDELKLSYPTIRNRLREIIRAMGYEPDEESPAGVDSETRRKTLDDLEKGKISPEEALRLLGGE